MDRYVGGFIAIETGNCAHLNTQALAGPLKRLHGVGHPSSIYPFILRIIECVDSGALDVDAASSCLNQIESFLFRRAVCGIEPTGLHAVFKGLWAELHDPNKQVECALAEPWMSPENIRKVIENRPTVAWPSDEDFSREILRGNFYKKRVAKHGLREFDFTLPGDTPIDDFEIEHILPQTLTPEWRQVFPDDIHAPYVHCWGNLVPLSRPMNPQLSNSAYSVKVLSYAQSMFSSPRDVAARFNNWTPEDLETRSNEICRWALQRWPYL